MGKKGRPPLPPEEKRSHRTNLTLEELRIIENLREHGFLPDTHVVKSDQSVEKLRAQRNEYKKRYNTVLEELDISEKRLETLLKLSDHKTESMLETCKMHTPKPSSDCTAVLVLSDWHVGETVDPSTVNDENIYNIKEVEKRVKKLFERSVEWIDLAKSKFKIKRLVMAMLGDIIAGYIHEELVENNSMSPTQEVLFAHDLINSGIDYITKHCKLNEILIPCSFGNHGRTTLNKKVSTSYKNSYEWLLYKFMQKKESSKIKFIVDNGYHTYLKLYPNYTIRFHHGDSIRYRDGVGGISIPINKAISKWNKSKHADLDVLGHFHQQYDGGHFICNGSLIGWNPYALYIKAACEPPQQSFFIIDKNYGKRMVSPIYVTD